MQTTQPNYCEIKMAEVTHSHVALRVSDQNLKILNFSEIFPKFPSE